MSQLLSVAVIGDRLEGFQPQDAIGPALAHAAEWLGVTAEVAWHDTLSLRQSVEPLMSADAVWCAPGSPFKSLKGALAGIETARRRGTSFLGTCAGFQHGVIEFARNVIGVGDAGHGEYAPDGGDLFIEELLCSLVGQRMTVRLVDAETRRIYGTARMDEEYYCRFGLNEDVAELLARHGLVVAGIDASDDGTRILRLAGHPFYVLTLFVPQTRSAPGSPHPLVTEFLKSALWARAPLCWPLDQLRAVSENAGTP